jgi:hypothetical protein
VDQTTLKVAKKFGAPIFVFLGPHHKFLEFIFLGSKFGVCFSLPSFLNMVMFCKKKMMIRRITKG